MIAASHVACSPPLKRASSRLPQPLKDLCRRSILDIKLLPHRLSHRSAFSGVSKYLFFIGYPRSGHTLFASLLNAHPNIVVAHELNALNYVRIGLSRGGLYYLLLQHDKKFEEQKRRWNGYNYNVPGQWQGKYDRISVIGDKKGGGSTVLLGKYPDLLERLRSAVGVPIRAIHYIRNPFDNITTISCRENMSLREAMDDYFSRALVNQDLKGRFHDDELLELHHEDIIRNPREALQKALDFLGLYGRADYVEACASVVFPQPRRTRHEGEWTPENIEAVKIRCAEVEFLRQYDFHERG